MQWLLTRRPHNPGLKRRPVFELLEERRLLSITPEQAGRFGDANLDGIVNGGDYTAWADHFGQTGAGYAGGDFNADTKVDSADYSIWANHFLQSPVIGNPDADANDSIDGADYTVWADHYGQTVVGPSQGDFTGDGLVNGADYTIWADLFGTAFDVEAPVFVVGLLQDTGGSATDKTTGEPAITGSISDTSVLLTFRLGLDGQPPNQYANAFSDLPTGNTFSMSRSRLEQLVGPLTDGVHTLHFESTDSSANTGSATLTFTLDTVAPTAPTFNLSSTSDTGVMGDNQTSVASVTLIGNAEPGSRLIIRNTNFATLASAAGTFHLPNVPLIVGVNPFTLVSSDLAGNASQIDQSFARSAQTAQTDVVLDWNQALLEAIRLDASTPPVASRAMAMVSTAVYDSVSAVDGTPGYLIARTALPGTSAEASAAAAAHRVLVYLYPAQQTMLDNQLNTSLAAILDGPGKSQGIALGESTADAIIAQRNSDGWNTFVDYTPGSNVGDWQETAPVFAPALLPQWADLRPFALATPEQFRPAGPPSLSSQVWADDYNEVKSVGRIDSATRTADQTQIARFWADGAGTYTPPGHWNRIAAQIAQQQGNSLAANARLFAQLNVALADAAIVAWDSKFTDNFWRPITAIQEAAKDGNAQTTEDTSWAPLLMTPPFPEYVSGHSTFSGAAAEVLNIVFGNDVGFVVGSVGLPGVQRTFSSFDQAAAEAGKSRIYGGIHFQFSNADGQAAGRQVAQLVLGKFAVQTDEQAPSIVISPIANTNLGANLVLVGSVFDNLSGVAELEAQLDGGAYTPVPVGTDSSFSLSTNLLLNGSADGAHTISFRARDAQGNQSSPLLFNWRLDTVAPLITLATPAADQPLVSDIHLTGTANPTGSNLVALSYRFDSAQPTPILFDAVTGAFDRALDISKLSVADHTLTLSATDAAGHTTLSSVNVTLDQAVPLTITKTTPTPGSSDVGSTFRPQVFFSRPVNTATLNGNNFYATDTTGAKLPATIVPAADGTFAWLFLTSPMPGSSTITMHVNGATILGANDGAALDADGDEEPGGALTYQFTTVSLAPLPNTTIVGKVVDPGPDFKPMTFDDARAGPDQSLGTRDDVFLLPIAHVKVFIAGRESEAVYTDTLGNFTIASVPAGDVKVVIDGRSATSPPADFFFPEMVMDSHIIVGQINTLMSAMQRDITHAEAQEGLREVYLPRLANTILKTVSDTEPTTIGVDAFSAPDLTPERRAQLAITVQPGSAIGVDGQPVNNPRIGISTVPPELVRDMLPAGLMQLSATLTIQAPEIATFAVPVQLTFPNLYNAAPGTKLPFYSFDHTTGRLVIAGAATVSPDGQLTVSDPGDGITNPGWYGVTPPGSEYTPPPPERDRCNMEGDQMLQRCLTRAEEDFARALAWCNAAAVAELVACVVVARRDPRALAACYLGMTVVEALCGGLAAHNYIVETRRCYEDNCPTPSLRVGDVNLAPVASIPSDAELAAKAQQLQDSAFSDDPISKQINQLVMQANELARSYVTTGAVIPDSVLDHLRELVTEMNTLAGGNATQYTADYLINLEQAEAPLEAELGGFAGEAPSYPVLYAAEIRGADGHATILRGETEGYGQYSIFVPIGSTINTITFYDPRTDRVGSALTRFSSNAQYHLDRFGLMPVDSTMHDNDNDGLPDIVELVYGTSNTQSDTNRDGISDRAQTQQGLNPLGSHPFATGIVASSPLAGGAKEIVLVGSPLNSTAQVAYVATGHYGLAVLDASEFQNPQVSSQRDLSGTATDLAVDQRLGIAAVASNEGGLHLINVSDPTNPQLLRSIHVAARQVEMLDGIAYVGGDGELRSYDLQTGEQLQRISFGSAHVTGMAREGNSLYVMAEDGTLWAVTIQGTSMIARGSVSLPNFQGRGKLFAGGGFVYAASNAVGFFDPFSTIDVHDPDHPTLITSHGGGGVAGKAVVANGSGLVLTTGTAISAEVDLFNVPDPLVRGTFVTQFKLAGGGNGIAIGSGIAFVATDNGVEVVNYRAFDNLGQAPAVNLSISATDVDAVTAGLQLFEGTSVPVVATISDDIQVRIVELLVNGEVVQNSVSFPFNLSTILSKLTDAPGGIVELQVRATDTGGNSALSNTVTVQLAPDVTAPLLIDTSPADGAVRGLAFRALTATFAEPIDLTGVNASVFKLIGPDGAVEPVDIQLRLDDRQAQFTYPALQPGNYQWLIHSTDVKDIAGNPLGTEEIVRQFEIRADTISWKNPLGGFWDDPANWDGNRVPGPNDDVSLDGANGAVIEYRTGATEVRSLRVSSPMKLSGGTLTVVQTVELNSDLNLAGGRLKDATVITGSGGGRIIIAAGTLTGVQLDADSILVNRGGLNIENGLTLNGTLTLGGFDPSIDTVLIFQGTQTLFGSGQIVLAAGGLTHRNHLRLATDDTVVTIGPGITIKNVGFDTTYYFTFGAGRGTLINQGTIIADLAAQETNSSSYVTFYNQGVLQARNGSKLFVGGLSGNLNTAQVTDSGSKLLLSGSDYVNNLALASPVGTTLTLNGNWINTGALNLEGGIMNVGGPFTPPGTFVSLPGAWTNAGTISVNEGTLNLGGTFTLAGLGALNRVDGTVNLTGMLDNTGTTLALNAITGSWNFTGGTIKNGTIAPGTGGAQLLVFDTGGGTLDGVTLDADLTLNQRATVNIQNGLMLNGTITLANNDGIFAAALRFNGTQTLSGTGQVRLGAGFLASQNRLEVGTSETTLTVAPGITIRNLTISGFLTSALLNQGTIISDFNGQQMSVGVPLTNQGTLQAANGGTLNVGNLITNSGAISTEAQSTFKITGTGIWTNTGSINVNGGTLTLGGAFTLAGVGTINRTGGTVNLTGTLDNTGTTLALNATTGSWNLTEGGTIKNGTIAPATGGAELLVPLGGSGTLDGVTLNADLTLPAFAIVNVQNGLTLNSTITLAHNNGNSSALLRFNGTQTLTGTGQVQRADGLQAFSNVLQVGTSGTTLTVASGITIRNVTVSGPSSSPLVNQGTILSDIVGQEMSIGMPLTNQGTLKATNGALLNVGGLVTNSGTINVETQSTFKITGTGIWTNTGSISVNGGTLNLGGTFTLAGLGALNRVGGTVKLTGALDNTGTTLALNAITGSWNFTGGTIKNGTIAPGTGGAQLSVFDGGGGTLDGVTLDADLTLNQRSIVNVQNGLTLNGTVTLANNDGIFAAALRFNGTQTLSGTGQVRLGTGFLASQNRLEVSTSGTTLTVAPGATIRNLTISGLLTSALINQGAIISDFNGQEMSIGVPLTNQGMLQAANGALLNAANLAPNTGTIATGVGSLVTINGTLTNNGMGIIRVDIAGTNTNQFGRVNATGATTIAGTLDLTLVDDFVPLLNSTFQVLTLGARTGTFDFINGTSIPGGLVFSPTYNATNIILTAVSSLQAATLPNTFREGNLNLSNDQLRPILAAAIERWRVAGVSVEDLLELSCAQLVIADLPGNLLGTAAGSVVTIDRDAVGYGWYVDSTPLFDDEFSLMADGQLRALAHHGDPNTGDQFFADDGMDLLTVVAHELGHLLELTDLDAEFDCIDVMYQSLAQGIRRLPR